MNKQALSVIAAAFALAAAALAFLLPVASAIAAVAAAAVLAYMLAPRKPSETDPHLIERLQSQAEQGRQLAIYERDTSLLAHWYVTLRGEEECIRAMRYQRQLTVLVVEPQSGGEEWMVKEKLADWLHRNTRHTDLVGYLGNGRFVAILTETPLPNSDTFVERLTQAIPPVEFGSASFPNDGATFATLLERAQQVLRLTAAAGTPPSSASAA